MFKLAFHNPGHFHAALTLRKSHTLVHPEIHVYAEEGPQVQAFLALVEAFNGRVEEPTAWHPVVVLHQHPLERLIADHGGDRGEVDLVVLAGRNDSKVADIAALHRAGLHVLADKPWLTGAEGLPYLEAATDGQGSLVMDIMTSHYDVTAVLQKKLIAEPDVFGDFRIDPEGEAAIAIESVHHLYKTVNGEPLVRPPWFFDIGVQGDGIVDIPTHLVDVVQWMLGGSPLDAEVDLVLEEATLWATEVPLDLFERITGQREYPETVLEHVRDGVLHYLCNGEFSYRLRGLPVDILSEWAPAIPVGGGDTQRSVLRGTLADVRVEHGAETGFVDRMTVHPHEEGSGVGAAVEAAVSRWQEELPGLAVHPVAGGYELALPHHLRTGHETHFAQVLDECLRYLKAGHWPQDLAMNLRAKYTLLAKASALARSVL